MPTKAVNAKSKRIDVRVPHQIVEEVELLKATGESTGQFVISALESEIRRRQRKIAREAEKNSL
ncbi:YlcI/YnfO family protein [Pantoea dispersa]|uniref:YlcI/YnfO family protein n=1 Tax=Pantoea dispersa TaxID=59814 RepID=UPI001331AB55|nr:YlcI/YnfO family protein [Pantoea dispersa]WEA06308.1 hypothetical protein PWF83_02490 [Pantoea dispersa]